MSKKKISIISSAYNEETNIPLLYAQVKEQMQKLSAKYDYEQLVLDNASQDGTLRVLREIAAQDPHFKVIANARNFGHIRSPYYGILQCGGDAVIYMASDLQDPPAVLPQLIQKWEEEEPIPEPAPEWKDVDGIGKYFRVWVLGTLLKMFNLPNPYQEEFDKEMERYTAHKPSTTEDDSADGSLRETIFGPGEGGGSS